MTGQKVKTSLKHSSSMQVEMVGGIDLKIFLLHTSSQILQRARRWDNFIFFMLAMEIFPIIIFVSFCFSQNWIQHYRQALLVEVIGEGNHWCHNLEQLKKLEWILSIWCNDQVWNNLPISSIIIDISPLFSGRCSQLYVRKKRNR